MADIHKKVKFKDTEYWLHYDEGDAHMLLSPIDHWSESGELLTDLFHHVSYAVIEGEDILRYHEVIGNLSDLVDVV